MGNLVITRRPGESVLIGKNVRVTILHANTIGAARIRITAPDDILILREELRDEEMETRSQPVDAGKGGQAKP